MRNTINGEAAFQPVSAGCSYLTDGGWNEAFASAVVLRRNSGFGDVCLSTVGPPSSPIPPEAATETVNGYPLAYVARGTGPTVVFVHGVLIDYRYWQAPLESWPASYRVVVVSLRHFNPERWDGNGTDFTVRQHAQDLVSFIERQPGPVHLVGWSYGGHVSYEAARARPDLIEKLVLVEAPLDSLVGAQD